MLVVVATDGDLSWTGRSGAALRLMIPQLPQRASTGLYRPALQVFPLLDGPVGQWCGRAECVRTVLLHALRPALTRTLSLSAALCSPSSSTLADVDSTRLDYRLRRPHHRPPEPAGALAAVSPVLSVILEREQPSSRSAEGRRE